LPGGTLITDVGSAKQKIVEALDEDLPRNCRFVGAHPLAGKEKAGAGNADADLFDGRVVVVTPTSNSRAEDYDLVEEFWEGLGSVVIKMSAQQHDEALAVTSHLPHVAAVALAASVDERLFRLSSSGLRDTSRLASGDPALWKQILAYNRDHVLAAMQEYGAGLAALYNAIRDDDQTQLEEILTKAKKNRDALGS